MLVRLWLQERKRLNQFSSSFHKLARRNTRKDFSPSPPAPTAHTSPSASFRKKRNVRSYRSCPILRNCSSTPSSMKLGQWAANLTSKSGVEWAPLFEQVGECRQMFTKRFERESYPFHASSVGQDSQMDRCYLPVSPESEGDFANTQQFCDHLSFSRR